MRVENIVNANGKSIANQFILSGITANSMYDHTEGSTIELASGEAFQSYSTMIAYKDFRGNLYLDKKYWNYSPTTSRHRNTFTGLDTKETKKGIEAGEILLIDLNGADHNV